jgi:hypothetical protein
MSNGASVSSSNGPDTTPDRIIQHVIQIEQEMYASWRTARADGSTDKFGNAGGDELSAWLDRLLRFGDQMPAVCYAHDITWVRLQERFPQFFSPRYHYDQVKGGSWPSFDALVQWDFSGVPVHVVEEILDKQKWDWEHMISPECKSWQGLYTDNYKGSVTTRDQVDFLLANRIRTPSKVLDIGGGRGEVAHFFSALGVPCVSIEPGLHAETLYQYTNDLFFNGQSTQVSLISDDIGKSIDALGLQEFDTIVFCESIEHIPEPDFWNLWHRIQKDFQGLIVITNWLSFHPIPVDPPEHIFRIDDAVYDRLISSSRRCIYRNQSHLVLEI